MDVKINWNETIEQRLFDAWKIRANSDIFFQIAQDVLFPISKKDFYYFWDFYTDWNEPKTFEDTRDDFIRTITNLLKQTIYKFGS